jgi:hypothetical protein
MDNSHLLTNKSMQYDVSHLIEHTNASDSDGESENSFHHRSISVQE